MRENLKKLSLLIFGALFPLSVFAECATPTERAKIGLEMNDAQEIEFFTKRLSAAGMAEYNKKMATPFSGKTTCQNAEQNVAPNSWKSKSAQECIGAIFLAPICINDTPDTSETSSKDFRQKQCEDSGGSYFPSTTSSDINDNCSCPNGMIITSGSIGKYISVKSCGTCSDGWEPDPDKNNTMCRKKTDSEKKTTTDSSPKPDKARKSLSEMAKTPDEKKLISEFNALNDKFDAKIKQLASQK